MGVDHGVLMFPPAPSIGFVVDHFAEGNLGLPVGREFVADL